MIRGLRIFCLRRAVYRKVLYFYGTEKYRCNDLLKERTGGTGIEDHTPLADVIELAKLYNDNGIDKITF